MPHSQQGFVLPMTLIVLALLTTLSMGLSQMARHAIADVEQRQLLLDKEMIMKSAGQQVLYRLLIGVPKVRSFISDHMELAVDGQPFVWDGVKISVQDEAGLMAMALYNPHQFERLLALWLSGEDARILAAKVGDWIDADSFPRPGSMEAAAYLKSATSMIPRDAPLRSLDGLLEIPAMTSQIYNGKAGMPGLRDLVVVGGADFFNPATAPDELIRPMLGFSQGRARRWLDLRQKHDWVSMQALDPDIASMEIEYHPGYVFILHFSIGQFSGKAMYRLSPFETVPYRLMMWQYPDHDRG